MTLPTSIEEIHTKALDRRGRLVAGPLPTSIEEIHSRTLRSLARGTPL